MAGPTSAHYTGTVPLCQKIGESGIAQQLRAVPEEGKEMDSEGAPLVLPGESLRYPALV